MPDRYNPGIERRRLTQRLGAVKTDRLQSVESGLRLVLAL